jgi:hypothetical protein
VRLRRVSVCALDHQGLIQDRIARRRPRVGFFLLRPCCSVVSHRAATQRDPQLDGYTRGQPAMTFSSAGISTEAKLQKVSEIA